MASDERKKMDAKMAEQNLLNAQAAKDTQAETDQFKCSRCHKRKCKYYQMQTRSADEPMTTFVSCLNCGNRWRVHLFFVDYCSILCFWVLIVVLLRPTH